MQITCHAELGHVCPTCGTNFLNEIGLYLAHLPLCKRTCQTCGRRFKYVHTFNEHKRRDHPNEADLTNVQIDDDLQMEITAEETSLLSHEDQGQSSVNPTTRMDNATVHKNANDHDVVCSSEQNSSEIQAGSKTISQPLAEDSSRQLTKHTKAKHQCPHCSKKIKSKLYLKAHIERCLLPCPCTICGITVATAKKMRYHMVC